MLSRRAGSTSQLQTRGPICKQASARVSRKQKVPSIPLAAEGSHKEIATPPPQKKSLSLPFPSVGVTVDTETAGLHSCRKCPTLGAHTFPVPLTCHLARPLPHHGNGVHPSSLSPRVQETFSPTEWPPCFLLVPPKASPLNCLKRQIKMVNTNLVA